MAKRISVTPIIDGPRPPSRKHMPLSATELANAMTAAHNVGDMEQVIALAVQGEGEADELVGVLLGSAQQAIGRIDDAIATFERLTQRWPDVSTHWNNLAVACRQRGDADTAEQAFLKAQSLAPDDAEVHYNLGLLYIEERRWLSPQTWQA
jgi:Flp pilus assembly protein TadD